ncbi:MAG TPA: hypothetical protein VMZ71_16805 [Gemmataceae bacterium]|nr:hypothetical protein [Gemmataceae bacterium]
MTFTVGTEATDAIAVAVQVNSRLRPASARTPVQLYLSTDSDGDVPAVGIVAPNGGWTVGTDGSILSHTPPADALLAIGTLAIDVVPEKFKTTTTATFTVGGWQTTKAAQTAVTFTAAHVVSASKFGVILIQVNSAGTISTKVPSATQAYNSAALAFAALPAADAGKVALGYIAIAAKAATWTANTDDLTNGSDLTTAAFVDAPLNGIYPQMMTVMSEADGDIDLTISETRIRTFYVNALVNGRKFTSAIVSFI